MGTNKRFAKKSITGNRTRTIKFRCTQHTYDVIENVAADRNISMSDLIHLALREFVTHADFSIYNPDNNQVSERAELMYQSKHEIKMEQRRLKRISDTEKKQLAEIIAQQSKK